MKRFAFLCLTLFVLLTACDPAAFHWITPEASLVPTVTIEPQVAPDPTAIAITEEEAPQVACDIKVNVSRDDIVYHLPGGVYYDRIKVDLSQGDFWACDEAEAIAAGARKSSR